MVKRGWAADLYRKEDWWSIWLGFLLLALIGAGIVLAVPKMPRWQWGDFSAALPSLLPLLVLAGGLCLIFAVAGMLIDRTPAFRFALGFVAASVATSFALIPALGEDSVMAILDQSKVLRGWLFCLAFVSIGLEANLREMAARMAGGKPVYLYLTGQGFNLALTLLVAWLVLSGTILPPPPQMGAGKAVQQDLGQDRDASALFYTESERIQEMLRKK